MLPLRAAALIRMGVALGLASGLAAPAWAAEAPEMALGGDPPAHVEAEVHGVAEPLIDFDIPAQPLVDALNQFGIASGRSALFRSKLVAGLNSSRVRGRYTPVAGLRLLLEGSGLDVNEASAGAVAALVIVAAAPKARVVFPPVDAGKGANYDGLVQARVWTAICANPSTAASGYRSLLRFGIDGTGKITRAHLVSSTGRADRDAALLDVLQHVQIDSPPPPDLVQPLTMLILPGQDGGPVCTAEGR